MAEIISATPALAAQPVAIRIIDVETLTQAQIDFAISEFFHVWEKTHVVSAPTFVMEGGKSRLFMQAVDKTRWLQQNEENGIARARMEIAYAVECKKFETKQVVLVTGSAPTQPSPQGDAKKGIRGAFGG